MDGFERLVEVLNVISLDECLNWNENVYKCWPGLATTLTAGGWKVQ